jgi:hypothetical protein
MEKDDGLITEMLNGFNHPFQSLEDEVFLDEEGLPTDGFLEALKSEKNVLPAFRNNFVNFENHFNENQIDKNVKKNWKRNDNGINNGKCNNIEWNDTDSIKSHPSSNNSNQKKYFQTKNIIKSLEKDSLQEKQNTKFKLTLKKKNETIQNDDITVKNKNIKKGIDITKNINKNVPTKIKSSSIESNQKNNFENDSKLDNEIELEKIIKKQNLRIQGLLNTIKTLETKFSEKNELLLTRDKQLENANMKLKMFETNTMLNSKQLKSFEDSKIIKQQYENDIEQYKVFFYLLIIYFNKLFFYFTILLCVK